MSPTTARPAEAAARRGAHRPTSPFPIAQPPIAGRDPVLDLVRAVALAVVVAWHWAFTTLRWDDGPRVGNPVGVTPGLWLATWFLQVMPLFFLVGGALHAAALDRAHDPAGSGHHPSGVVVDREFVSRRLRRLVVPALPMVGLAGAAAVVATAIGRPDVVRGIVLMITPLWFLAVYLVLVLLAPLARRLHHRFGLWAPALGAAAVAIVDRVVVLPTRGEVGLTATLAVYVLTWSVVHQLGFHLGDLRSAPRSIAWTTAVGGLLALFVGANVGGYPASMVGTRPDPISNLSPPDLMVVFLAVAQMGMLVVAEPVLRRWCGRHRATLGALGTWSMTVYVWHMLALAGFWGLVVVIHGGAVRHTVDASWWAQRPLWLVGPLVLAVPLFALIGPGRSRGEPAGPGRWRSLRAR